MRPAESTPDELRDIYDSNLDHMDEATARHRQGQRRGCPMTTTPSTLSRWELLQDDPRFGLSKGDVLICESMHWAWADEKIAVLRRESDGYEPGCSMYRHMVRHLSGPTLGHVHARDDR